MTIEELKGKMSELRHLINEKIDLERVLEIINTEKDVTYLPLGNVGCYVSTRTLIHLLKSEIISKEYEISILKKEIGVDE